MSKTEQVEKLTNYMANFVSYIGKVLPDDIIAKLDELAEKEDSPLSKTIYQTMKLNQKLAKDLNRPSCQDTGVLQFWSNPVIYVVISWTGLVNRLENKILSNRANTTIIR